jgi:hypothetical protein
VFENINIADAITLVVFIVGALLGIAGAVVKFTKTKKDDEVFEDVEKIVKPVLDAVDKNPPKD